MSSIIARAPTRGELERAAYICQIAFNMDFEHLLRSFTWVADNRGLDYLVVAEIDGELVSSLICTPGQACFDGDIVPLSAVGAVGTLPEHRRQGIAGVMMEETVRVLLRHGFHTSALWPFSYNYYRKYGWEIGGENRLYKLPTEFAATLASPDSVRPAMESDLPAVSALVDRFAADHNAVTVRDDLWWSVIKSTYQIPFDGEDDIMKCNNCPWVHETGGKVDGYAFFCFEDDGDGRVLRIRELIADTPEARRALLSKLATADVPKITLPTPIDDGFMQELPNPREIKALVEPGFQFRVINPPAALEARTVDPSISGRIGFTIADPVLETWNFDIEVDEGRVSTDNSRAVPRLTMDVRTFAQLYSGYVSPKRAAELGRLQSDSEKDLELASKLLHRGVPFRSFLEIG